MKQTFNKEMDIDAYDKVDEILEQASNNPWTISDHNNQHGMRILATNKKDAERQAKAVFGSEAHIKEVK